MPAQLLGLRSLIYPSSDVTTAKEWWTSFLGFGPYFDEPFYVGFNVAGYELGIVASDSDDVAAAVVDAQSHGAVVVEGPNDVGEGIIVASVENPLGQIVGLIFNPHFVAG
jgi:hypothetical protein